MSVHLIHTDSGKLIDLYEVETIALTYRFTDILSLAVTGGFTRQFRIPFSGTNLEIFGALFDPNVSVTSNYFHKKMDAELRVDTMPISVGHVQVNRALTQNGKVSELEITFFAETPNLAKELGAKKLKDIAALADLNHAVTYTAVTATTEDYRYILADRGFKLSELGEPGTRSVLNVDAPLYAGELTPCVKWSWLFDKIITEAGFVYDASALFTLLDGYYMPFINSKAIQYAIPPEGYFFRAGYTTNQLNVQATLISSQLTGLTETYDNNSDFASSVYTAPYTGTYTFRIFATFRRDTNPGGAPLLGFRLIDISSGAAIPNGVTPLYNPPVGQTINIQYDVVVTLTQGQQIGLYMGGGTPQVDLFGDADNDFNSGTGFALIGFDGALYGQTIDFAKNAPDMTQIEFIRDVINMHNCAVVPDRNIPNKLMFKTMTTYIGSGATRDWTGKLDLTKDIVVEPTTALQNSKLKFTYKQGGDVWNKIFQDAGRTYGEYEVTGYTVSSSDTPNDFAQGDLTVQLVTQPTPCNAISGSGIVIPKFVNDKGEFVNPGARILYIAGTANIAVYDDITDEVGEITEIALGNHYSQVNAEVDDYDLNFAPEAQPFTITGTPYNNLFNVYWRSYLNEIYSPDARILTAYFNLNVGDVLEFSFADEIFIVDTYYRILEISGYGVGANDPTQVKLIKIINTQLDCPVRPFSINLNGSVNFVDNNGDAATATQTCCERYGYRWEALGSLCFQQGFNERPNPTAPQGMESWGVAPTRAGVLPDFSLTMGMDIQQNAENVHSITSGQSIQSTDINPNSIIVGERIVLEGDHGAVAVFGKNVTANTSGVHIGGGWNSNDRTAQIGNSQIGTIVFNSKGGFDTSSTEIELLINGIAANRLNLKTPSAWGCILTVSVQQIVSGVVGNTSLSQFAFVLKKELVSGTPTATAGTITDIFKQTTFGTPNLVIDVASDVDEHRLKITKTGSGHPHTDCFLTARLDYIQFRHD